MNKNHLSTDTLDKYIGGLLTTTVGSHVICGTFESYLFFDNHYIMHLVDVHQTPGTLYDEQLDETWESIPNGPIVLSKEASEAERIITFADDAFATKANLVHPRLLNEMKIPLPWSSA